MARSNIKAVFENDVQTVWNVITDVKNYIWRTDLSKTEIISDKQFIEYTKNGYATTFTITLFEPYKRWEFDVENSNIKGHWIGIFTQKGEKTEIDFTEDVTAKKVLMKPFVKAYLKKQQARYADLLYRFFDCPHQRLILAAFRPQDLLFHNRNIDHMKVVVVHILPQCVRHGAVALVGVHDCRQDVLLAADNFDCGFVRIGVELFCKLIAAVVEEVRGVDIKDQFSELLGVCFQTTGRDGAGGYHVIKHCGVVA